MSVRIYIFSQLIKKKSGLTFELLELKKKKEKYDILEKSCSLQSETVAVFWDRRTADALKAHPRSMTQ